MNFKVTAQLSGGGEITLPPPIILSVSYGTHTPATSCSASFHGYAPTQELSSFQLWDNHTLLFSGSLDEARYIEEGGEQLFHIVGRNQGGALLDNQARPETLWGANIATIFARLIRGFGFSLDASALSQTLPEYTIHQGTSRWKAFSGFVQQLSGSTPWVGGRVIYCGQKPSPSASISYGNLHGHRPFISFQKDFIPYHMLSKIYLRDDEGSYSAYATHPKSSYYNIHRERYLTPWGEDAQHHGQNAQLLFREGLSKAFSYSLVVDDFILPPLGETGQVILSSHTEGSLHLRQVKSVWNNGKATTTLSLGKEPD